MPSKRSGELFLKWLKRDLLFADTVGEFVSNLNAGHILRNIVSKTVDEVTGELLI